MRKFGSAGQPALSPRAKEGTTIAVEPTRPGPCVEIEP
jgi:hypothetical protein